MEPFYLNRKPKKRKRKRDAPPGNYGRLRECCKNNIHIRICYRITHARLRRKIHDDFGVGFRKDFLNERLIREIPFYECPFASLLGLGKLFNLGKTVFLDGNIVVVIHIVKSNEIYTAYGIQKLRHKVRANKSGCPCDKNCFVFKFYIRRQHFFIPLYSFFTAS